MSVQNIIKETGLQIRHITPVAGGDINEAFCLESADGQKYFLKVNDAARYPAMFVKEATGLKALQNISSIKIPAVLQCGEASGKQYLLLEWLDKGAVTNNFWKDFASGLATMHKAPATYFGFEADNYIGSLVQSNNRHADWAGFYTECRIMPLTVMLKNRGLFSSNDVHHAKNFCKKIGDIFPDEPPSLLHGDLWSGNFMITENGAAAIYDPAVYFGHREMDMGMTLIFGGFAATFYSFYNEEYPLEKNWRSRISYTQLYPLLVHAVLFGGRYTSSAREIISKF